MKKTIIASVLAASVSTVAVAHESEQHHETVNISSESCNLKFQNKLSISPDLVTIDAQSGKVEIDQSGNLTVNGEVQQVSSNDQTLLSQYAQTVREQVPQVAEIAMDGVELDRVRAYRIKYYADLVTRKPDLEKFYFGWFRRGLEV